MSTIDDLPDYEEIENLNDVEESIKKKFKLDKKKYKKPDIIPHYIIVGHGQVRSYAKFQNIYNCIINYFCTRGNLMLAYLHYRPYLIQQMENMCNRNIISKEILNYGEEIDNTEFSATNEIEANLFGVYSCDNLDMPIFNFELQRIYTLEELLSFLELYTIRNSYTNYFEVSIIGCRPVDEKSSLKPDKIYTEHLTGSKRKYSQIAGKKNKKTKKNNKKNTKTKVKKRKTNKKQRKKKK